MPIASLTTTACAMAPTADTSARSPECQTWTQRIDSTTSKDEMMRISFTAMLFPPALLVIRPTMKALKVLTFPARAESTRKRLCGDDSTTAPPRSER
jgi:hypothetical protein